jgi:ligand-binding sensor domain-containing protein/signal transduction histidine kinase
MRKRMFVLAILLAVLLASCGTSDPASVLKDTPTASPPDLGPDPVSGSSSIPYGKNVRFERLSLEEGLSQSVVHAILQDQAGFLWIGTDDGLNRYDGYEFKVYKPENNNPNSLGDRSITSLAEDENGYLWIGTRLGGLNRYDPRSGKFTRYTHDKENEQSISSNQIHDLYLDENGLWIGTDNGLDFLDFKTNSFTHRRASPDNPFGLNSNSITALFKDSSGLLWIGTANAGVNVYDIENDTYTIYKFDENNPASLSHNRILSVVEGKKGEIWIGTANGLNRFNAGAKYFSRFMNSKDSPYSLAGNTVYALYVDRAGGLWIGTNNGLDRYDPQSYKFIHHQNQPSVPNTLSNNQVYAIHEDASGVLWVGTYGGGLNKYNRQQDRFAYYRHNPDDPNSLSDNFVFPILVDANGYVWIGTYNGGLNRFTPLMDEFTHFKHDPDDPTTIDSNSVISLYIDREGTLWVGTMRGLDRYNPDTNEFSHFQPADAGDGSGFTIFSMYEDSQGTFWVGSKRGLAIFDKETQTFIEHEFGELYAFNGNIIDAILEDKDGSLWVGTFDDGLKRINLKTGEVIQYHYDPADATTLGSNAVMSIYQDGQGILWFGTHGGGLNRYNPATGTFSRFTEDDGLLNNVIYGIVEDNPGNLWLSTNFGLSRFDPVSKAFRNFTASDGLQSNEFNQNAYARDHNGNLYFGGINGLNVFTPREIRDNPYPPKVALISISQDGVPLIQKQTAEYLQTITLKWPQDSFEFEFAAFAYEQPSRNQYSYMLEGFDADWVKTGSQRNGRYTNLPGGAYTLRLRGSNSDGVWSERGQSIKIVVVPPFWETWWFRGVLVILFGAAVAGALRWRVKSIQNRNRELERLVKKRTADLEKRTSEIDALYRADEKILRSVTLNQVFQTLVDVSTSTLRADRSAVFAWNEKHRKIMPRVSHGFRPKTLSTLAFGEGEGIIGHAMSTGEAVIVSNLETVELREDARIAIRSEGIQSLAYFPIVIDGKVMAVFNVAYTRPNALNEDAIRLFTALVNRASLSIANMELFEQTKDLAVMEERNRLARDLHDSAKQKAFAALAQLGTVNGIMKTTVSSGAKPHLNEAETLIYEVIQELNFLIQEIYPIALQEQGLQTTLREYIFEWENRNDIAASLVIRNDRQLPLDVEQAVYRFVQEALANVSRHSKSSRVDISLVYNIDSLQVTISDNGQGFDINQKAKGMGFRSMRERIGSVRGTVQIQSAPGQGTCLIAQLPIHGTGELEYETSSYKYIDSR